MQDTTPEEVLWSFRDRLRSKLKDANEANCEVVRDLDNVDGQVTLQNTSGFLYLIEPGAIVPVEGFGGGGICNEYRAMRVTVEVQRVNVVDMPFKGDDLLTDLSQNVYAQAAAVVHAIGNEPLTQKGGEEDITPAIPSATIDFIPDGNRKAVVRIPFDIEFGWDIERHNPDPPYTG